MAVGCYVLSAGKKRLDPKKVFPRSDGCHPFLVLDWHDSRFELPFVCYIKSPVHPWICCIDVLYGTGLCQVDDSKKQNGSFKINMNKGKQKWLEKKEKKCECSNRD